MERRNRSIEALKRLQYVDSLDPDDRARELTIWVETYLPNSTYENFGLELKDLEKLYELFYRNIKFLKEHKIYIKEQLDSQRKIKEFLQ